MGLETYLLKVEFKNPIPKTEMLGLFDTIGMTSLYNKDNKKTTDTYSSYYFELRTKNGLTEAHCLVAPSEVTFNNFSIRFSIISPKLVIDQTFMILKRLNQIHPIKIFGKEGKIFAWFSRFNKIDNNVEKLCYIPINAEGFILNEYGLTKRKLVINSQKGEVIESGLPTLNFIYKNQIYDKYIGWFKKEML